MTSVEFLLQKGRASACLINAGSGVGVVDIGESRQRSREGFGDGESV